MNKALKTLYKRISVLLILILPLNSFAAIVSDNDGSAFITKAEFDSLKNDFQAQIDQYMVDLQMIFHCLIGIKSLQWHSGEDTNMTGQTPM